MVVGLCVTYKIRIKALRNSAIALKALPNSAIAQITSPAPIKVFVKSMAHIRHFSFMGIALLGNAFILIFR